MPLHLKIMSDISKNNDNDGVEVTTKQNELLQTS